MFLIRTFLPLSRFVSKLLTVLPIYLISPDQLFLVLYLVMLLGAELSLLRRFERRGDFALVIAFSSFFSYLVPLITKDRSVFFIFLVSDFFSVLSILFSTLIIAVVIPGFIFFSVSLPFIIFANEILRGDVKPYQEMERKIDFVKMGKLLDVQVLEEDKVRYARGELVAKFKHGGDVFLFIGKTLDSDEVMALSILLLASSVSLSIYIHRFIEKRKRASKKFKEPAKTEVQEFSDYRKEDQSIYIEYVKETIAKIEENLKREMEFLEKREKLISELDPRYNKIVERSDEYKRNIRSFLSSSILRARMSEDHRLMVNRMSELISYLEEIYVSSRKLIHDISSKREKISQYERNVTQAFREFENLFHEIFSPLGGIENQAISAKTELSGTSDAYYKDISSRSEVVISELGVFLKVLGEIYESFHILHLNSQVRAHKIRDKFPSFEVIPQAIYIMLEKMKELMENIKSELNTFERFVQNIKVSQVGFFSLFSDSLEELRSGAVEIKSSVENVISSATSLRSSFVSNLKSLIDCMSEVENTIASAMDVVSGILHNIYGMFSSVSYALNQIYMGNEDLSRRFIEEEKEKLLVE